MLKPIWWHRDLLVSLVRRQCRLRYRQSAVIFDWALPLASDFGPVQLPATWSEA